MKPQVPCKCGASFVAESMVTLNEVGVPDQKVLAVVRRFSARCPKCGPIFLDIPGHHDTIGKTERLEQFPLEYRDSIRDALPREERKAFDQSMAGWREPTDEQMQRWLQIQDAVFNAADKVKP